MFYYSAARGVSPAGQTGKSDPYEEEQNVVKVNQEELAGKIGKLKEKAKAVAEKAGGKKSDPAVRTAKKNVKRAQRKLRAAKSYKTSGKKKTETASA